MLDKKQLQIEREKAYKKWFERCYQNTNVEKRIEISNLKGYTTLKFKVFFKTDSYIYERVSDDMFLEYLQEKLPDFKIEKEYYTNSVIGIFISWGYDRIEAV